MIVAGGPLTDGTYRFAVRRVDAAGNATDGPAQVVTIDATPPAPIAGLTHQGGGRFRFEPRAGAVDYTYRVGNGPTIPLAGATSFSVRGLPFDPTPVTVRAIDTAGNLGAEATVIAHGCRQFLAYIQPQNTRFFERLGWRPLGDPVIYQGQPHQLMQASLAAVRQSPAAGDRLLQLAVDR